MKCLSEHPYSKKPTLPCENPDRTPVYSFRSWQSNIVPDRFLLHFKNLSDIVRPVEMEKNIKSMEKKFFAMK